ncbi:unnamed protein product [Strongylus vulgaris]|uniref:Uncharacterized protein n=1 Tax=Strongylus vulgaris TaxID=40348 RepID=A0A3P7J8H2_STRVU|nr:unnamed protein product [Strongylus vulgaris]
MCKHGRSCISWAFDKHRERPEEELNKNEEAAFVPSEEATDHLTDLEPRAHLSIRPFSQCSVTSRDVD